MSFLAALLPAVAGAGTIGADMGLMAGPIIGDTAALATASSAIPYGAIFQGLSMGSQILSGLSGSAANTQEAAYLNAQAKSQQAAGAANADRIGAIDRARLGALKAQVGASGTTMSGSPMLVYLDSVKNAALDSADAMYRGNLEAWSSRAQAKQYNMAASNSLWGGFMNAGLSLGSRLLAA